MIVSFNSFRKIYDTFNWLWNVVAAALLRSFFARRKLFLPLITSRYLPVGNCVRSIFHYLFDAFPWDRSDAEFVFKFISSMTTNWVQFHRTTRFIFLFFFRSNILFTIISNIHTQWTKQFQFKLEMKWHGIILAF